MGWGEVDATTYGFGDRANTRADNGAALRAAYEEAVRLGVSLYLPAGTYEVELRGSSHVLALNAYWDAATEEYYFGEAPLVGAGAGVTRLRFFYPSGGPSYECYGFYMPNGAPGTARVEGMTLELADWVGGPADPYDPASPSDGIGEPRTFGVYIRYAEALVMIDVHTTGWNVAIVAEVTPPNKASLHLERCDVSSRGVRVSWATGRATLIHCTIGQDADGFVTSSDPNSFYPGVYLSNLAYLLVRGGRSLGNREGNTAYSFHSDSTGSETPRSIAVKDHNFQSMSGGAVQFTAAPDTGVLIDNCTFVGTTALAAYGTSTTYHVSNCVFDVEGHAITDGDKGAGADAEVHVTNCRITSSSNHSVIRRMLTTSSKPWYFSNCTLVNTGDGSVVNVIDGLMYFFHCHLGTSQTALDAVIGQKHGRIELHDCTIEASRGACSFDNFYYTKVSTDPVTLVSVYTGVVVRALQVVFERCSLGGASPHMFLAPHAPMFIRGRGNRLGRINVWAFLDHSLDSDDAGGPIPDRDPGLLESDLQLKRGRATASVSGDALKLDWNADWIEVESVDPVRYVLMRTDFSDAYTDGRANYPVGARYSSTP